MISDRKLASSHSSFWRQAMPLSEAFVRAMNLKLERFARPLPESEDPSRNAPISELAFRLFASSLEDALTLESGADQQASRVQKLAEEVIGYISLLERGSSCKGFGKEEIHEAFTLARRIKDGLSTLEPGSVVRARPRFVGCGVISDCEGDLLADVTLYEVKNVERHFRVADIRQVLCYCALNFASKQYVIHRIGLLNARAGLAYRLSLDSIALSAAGVPAADLLGAIVSYATADRPSK